MRIPKVVEVQAQDNYMLSLCFENGARKLFDAKPLFSMPIYKPLSDQDLFRNVSVDRFGGITWGNGIDCCRDTLYAESIPA